MFQNPLRLTYALQIDAGLKSTEGLKAHARCLSYESQPWRDHTIPVMDDHANTVTKDIYASQVR